MIRLTDLENYTMLMEIYMKGIGMRTKLMVKVHIRMLMELDTRVTGEMINSMDLELKHGLMGPYMRANTMRERKMEREN
jgi:hypothetical protein